MSLSLKLRLWLKAAVGNFDLGTELANAVDTAQSTADAAAAAAAAAVSDTAYAAGWNGVTTVAPSKNAVYDKLAAMVSDTAYGAGWNGVTDVAPSQNAVYDIVVTKQNVITMGQQPNDGAGDLTIAGMTATGKVIVTPAEDLGNDLVFSHVVAGVGTVRVYVKDASGVSPIAAAALTAVKLWNVVVISLS
jgi:hypothetical protein